MTKNEAAVIMAYTGQVMLTGDDLDIFHRYIKRILNRPVFTHELSSESVWEEIKEKSKNDFIDICKNAFDTRDISMTSEDRDFMKELCNKYKVPEQELCDRAITSYIEYLRDCEELLSKEKVNGIKVIPHEN